MKELKKYGVYIGLIFSLVALVMLFLQNGIMPKETLGWEFKDNSIFDVIFGRNQRLEPKLNILAFVSLLLLVVGTVVSFLAILPSNIRYGVAALLLLLSGIFLFVIPSTITLDNFRNVVHGTPLIVAGIFVLLASIINGGLAVVHTLKK